MGGVEGGGVLCHSYCVSMLSALAFSRAWTYDGQGDIWRSVSIVYNYKSVGNFGNRKKLGHS